MTSRSADALRRFRDRMVTADAVYGTILFAALIAVAGNNEDLVVDVVTGDPVVPADPAGTKAAPLEVLVVAGSTLLVFWMAHVYARTIARYGVRSGEEVGLGASFRRALGESSGMLTSAIPSVVILVLGALGLVPYADEIALFAAILVLFWLGYQSMAEREAKVWARLLGGLASSLLGAAIVALDIAVH